MNATASAPRRSNAAYRWVRQFHLWIGAWGALAAILYGITGLVMNHRFGDGAWPQGDSEELGKTTLAIPAEARATPEQLSLWLRDSQQLDAQVIRKGKPGDQAAKWNLSGGTASNSWSLEYAAGSDSAELKRSSHTALAAFNRLHKGVGGGGWWILLADSFAIGMILLGISGLLLWARNRTPKQLLVSVLAASALAWVIVVGPSLA